jgi:opine dehydrogenase
LINPENKRQNMKKYRITVIGAGNGGHAIAGHFGLLGHEITIYDRMSEPLVEIQKAGGIQISEALIGFGKVKAATTSLKEAVKDAEIIMVATTADAHAEIARNITPYLEENQIIVLNPGRTCGAIEFRKVCNEFGLTKKVFIAEAQSLIYACRIESPGKVRIIGVKDKVLLATLPSSDTKHVTEVLNGIFNCFIPVKNVMVTSLENIGAIFHPSVVLFNAATIERGQTFFFYNDMTPAISRFLEKIDTERLAVGKAWGIQLTSATEWISLAYPNITGDNLCSKMKNNPAYYKILAPSKINSRLLLEDIPTGILPMMELGKLAEVQTPLMNAVFTMGEQLLDRDFRFSGRTLENLGIKGKTIDEILTSL